MKNFQIGIVITTTGTKTIKVIVQLVMYNIKYKKFWTKNIKLLAHDLFNEAQLGDIVILQKSRAWSRFKHWTLQKVIKI